MNKVHICKASGANQVTVVPVNVAVALGDFLSAWCGAFETFKAYPLQLPEQGTYKAAIEITVRTVARAYDGFDHATPMRLMIASGSKSATACCFIEEVQISTKPDKYAYIKKTAKEVVSGRGGEVFLGANSMDVSIVVPPCSPGKRSQPGGDSVGATKKTPPKAGRAKKGTPPKAQLRRKSSAGFHAADSGEYPAMVSDMASIINDFTSKASLRDGEPIRFSDASQSIAALVAKYEEKPTELVRAIAAAFGDNTIISSISSS